MALWSTHLNHEPYGPYDACFDRLPVPEPLVREESSGRVEQLRGVLAAMAGDLAGSDGVPVFLVGDFNTPSHLDWTDNTGSLHCGYGAVPWPVTQAAEAAGLHGSYRTAHPDPLCEPGATWSPIHEAHEDGSGRPEPQDRIDYVLYAGRGLRVADSRAYTSGSVRQWPEVADSDWPSDHAAVVTTVTLD
ncbi:endonuclease/exonuclease/phosphatase family protein [Streptomyces polyrhachis]|uniref:Endonuclease/exonuclease/phosphatase family protein n=1 Tax=Streptomyces polyrhachis TaxID=1282885 RepID=A0ABW2GMJ3_9ACTN